MRQIEKEVLILGMISAFLKQTNMKIEDIIPEFDRKKFKDLSDTLPFMVDEQIAEEALKYLTVDIYKRVSKKFPKG